MSAYSAAWFTGKLLSRFPVIEKTEHWTVVINILSQLRGSVLLIPSRCIKSFRELLPAELETYRNLIIKYQDLLHQDTGLDAFNTGWQEDSSHICVKCAVRSPNDAGAITGLLRKLVTTRNPRILYEKMCGLQNVTQEEIVERTSGETDPSTLPSFRFFDKRDKNPRRTHHFDSSDRETHKAAYAAPTTKKKPTYCFFCSDLERGIDTEGSPLVYAENRASACIRFGSYAPHIFYISQINIKETSHRSLEKTQWHPSK